ncbi:MAG: SRPBCC family protein [Candidatus Neomarinimicrobiota bacterium]
MTSVLPKPDIESSVWIARPPEYVWKYLYDVSNDTRWRSSVKAGRWISDPPYGIGSTGLHVIEGVGDWPWRITEWEEPYIITWYVTGNRFEGSHAGYRIAPDGTGSRVTAHMRIKPGSLMRIIIRLMKRRITSQLTADLEKLKAIMEA